MCYIVVLSIYCAFLLTKYHQRLSCSIRERIVCFLNYFPLFIFSFWILNCVISLLQFLRMNPFIVDRKYEFFWFNRYLIEYLMYMLVLSTDRHSSNCFSSSLSFSHLENSVDSFRSLDKDKINIKIKSKLIGRASHLYVAFLIFHLLVY